MLGKDLGKKFRERRNGFVDLVVCLMESGIHIGKSPLYRQLFTD